MFSFTLNVFVELADIVNGPPQPLEKEMLYEWNQRYRRSTPNAGTTPSESTGRLPYGGSPRITKGKGE
jgi:hypothetical protein